MFNLSVLTMRNPYSYILVLGYVIKLNKENVLQILIPRTKYDIQTDKTAALHSEGFKFEINV